MKKLFTLLVIFTFFVSALSVAQIKKKDETKKEKQVEKVKQTEQKQVRDDGIKSFVKFPEIPGIPLNTNNTHPLFNNNMSQDAVNGYTFTSSSGTYTALSTETILWSGFLNDQISDPITIPGFTMDGPAFTTMYVSANGWITLGAIAPSGISPISGDGTYSRAISAFGWKLNHADAGTPKISYNTNDGGEIVIQYQDVRRYSFFNERLSFQIRLNPSTGDIKFVYGGTITGMLDMSNLQVGLRGSTNTDYNNRTTTTDWSATTAGESNAATCKYSSTVLPAVGQTFTWAQPIPPAIVVSPSTLAFGYVSTNGTSPTKTYSLNGTNLTADPIVLTPPPNFEISTNGGTTWVANPNTISIAYTPPTLGSTTISVRFKPTSLNTEYSGNITNVGGGATINVAVSGNSIVYLRYCTSGAFYIDYEEIYNVTLGTLNNSSTCGTLSSGPGSIAYIYNNYTTNVSAPDLDVGVSTAFSIQTGSCAGNSYNAIKIFIDYNQDGDFEDINEEVYVSNSPYPGPHTETGNITVPEGASIGYTMMRVVNVATDVPSLISACGTYFYGETEDYLVNIVTPTNPLLTTTPSSIAFGFTGYPGTSPTQTYVLSGARLGEGPIVVTPPAGFEVSLDGSTWSSTFVNVTYTAPTLPNTTIYTHFIPLASNAAYSGNITNVGGGATTNVAVSGSSYFYSRYCTSNATFISDEDIFNVTLGTLNNTSTCATTGTLNSELNKYSNYTATVTPPDLEQGSSNAFSVGIGTCHGTYNNATKIFIDFNQDGDFLDAGEEVYLSVASTSGAHTETGNISVPIGATLGNTMMRVINVETGTPSDILACGNYDYGETEDYLVNIIPVSPMAYTSSTTTQNTSTLAVGSTNQQIIGIEVVTTGGTSPLSITDFALNTTGTTAPSTDISNAKIFYTGTNSSFSAIGQFGSTVASPNGVFSIAGTQTLAQGTNYFWLTYDIPSGATGGNNVDAECTQITIGSTYTPTVTAPAGVRQIIGSITAGTYTVGLAAFNKATGRNIYEHTVTRSIKNDDSKKTFLNNDTINATYKSDFKTDRKDGIERKIMTELTTPNSNERLIVERKVNEETVKVLYENGKPYVGPLYYFKDKNKVVSEKNSNGITKSNIKNSNEYQTDDPNAGVYATITAAITDLNARGISGAVVFSLTDAEYPTETFPITINTVTGASATNTITIKPASGVTTTISGGSANGPVFKIFNTNYVTIDGSNNGTTSRNMSLTNTSATAPQVIWIGSNGTTPITNVNVKNCNLTNGVNTSSAVIISDGNTSGNAGYFDNINIQNNLIQKAYIGVYATGGTTPQNGSNLNLINNTLNSSGTNSISYVGLYMQGVNGANISGNEIANFDQTGSQSDAGIWLATGTKNAIIEKNKIYTLGYSGAAGYGAHGMDVSTAELSSNIIIENNLIYHITGDGFNFTHFAYADNPMGIHLFSTQTGLSVYNNTINLYGNTLNQHYAMSMGICLGTGTTADIRNNIIVNNLGLSGATGYGSVAIHAQTDFNQFTDINFNNYYVSPTGSGIKAIGQFQSNPPNLTLASWVTATGKDANSVSNNPGFTSNTNLIPNPADANSWVLSGNGIHLAGVTTDYAGTPRPADVTEGAPDIGAYEFTAAGTPNSFVITPVGGPGTNDIYVNGRKLLNLYFSNLGGITSIDVKFYSGVVPPGTSGYPVMNGYFVVTQTGGSGFVYDLTYFYSEPQIGTITGETLIRLSKSDNGGTNWTAYTAPGTGQEQYALDNTANTIKVHQLISFSIFTNGGGDNPLPVTLSSFTFSMNGRDVVLNWKTDKETNNSGFDVERKTNGSNVWSKVGFVIGKGSSNAPANYTFEDMKLNSGKYNYRLKQIDFNGNFEYHTLSSIVDVALPTKFNLSQNYPNPFNPVTKINFDIPENGLVNLRLYDMLGREVATLVNEVRTAGYYTVNFDASKLSSGIYFYRMNAGKFSSIKKMAIIK